MGGGDGKSGNMNEPARNVCGGNNGASGVTNVGSTVASGQPRGRSYTKGKEEQDSGMSAYRTYATNEEGITPALIERRPEPLAQHYA